MLSLHMIRTAIILGFFAITGTGLVALTYDQTKDRIAAAERENMLRKLHSVVQPDEHDNDMFNDFMMAQSEKYLGSTTTLPIFFARQDGITKAVIITSIAPDGYSGDIKLLIGVYRDGSVSGVRILNHRETPGLGDFIDERKSNWVDYFKHHSLNSLTDKQWKVKRDGGVFDQFTGATITPRAIVKAVHKALKYVEENHESLFGDKHESTLSKNSH